MEFKTQYWGWNTERKHEEKIWSSQKSLKGCGETAAYWVESNEPKSLPSFDSSIYRFEVEGSGSSSSNSKDSLTRSNSGLSFFSQSKRFEWFLNESLPSQNYGYKDTKLSEHRKHEGSRSRSCLNTTNQGSSNIINSLEFNHEGNGTLDWSKLVDNVFKEEKLKLAERVEVGNK